MADYVKGLFGAASSSVSSAAPDAGMSFALRCFYPTRPMD